jgi:hypothetical protein
MMMERIKKKWKIIEANPIQSLEFYNTGHESGSQHKSLTWKNNNVKCITN